MDIHLFTLCFASHFELQLFKGAPAIKKSGSISGGWIAKGLGGLGVALASVNIFGGFLVTQRMLAMYKKKGD